MPGYKKAIFSLISTLLVLCCLITGPMDAQELPQKKNILVLHGLLQTGRWNNQFDTTFYTEMTNNPDLNVSIIYDYLGLEYYTDDTFHQKVISQLRDKTGVSPVDIVIGVLPRSNKFLLLYGQDLFPGIPKIFVIPGSRNASKIQGTDDAFIIKSASAIILKTNIERIYSILPDTQHLTVICGTSVNDRYFLSQAQKAITSSDKGSLTNYLVGIPPKELFNRISKLPEHTAILFLTFDRDINNKKYLSVDFFPELSDRANAPVFGFYDTLLGMGIIGGSLTSAEFYAEETAEISKRVLRGEKLSEISPVKDVSAEIYDWRQLKRWNISEDRLPPGSVIRFKTETFWKLYKLQIIFVLVVIILQTLLIIALFTSLKHRRAVEEALVKSESTARALLNTPSMLVILLDINGKILDANDTAINKFSSSRSQFIGSSVWDYISEDTAAKRKVYVNQVIQSGEMQRFEDEDKDRWLDNVLNPIFNEKGKVEKVAVLALDITKRKQVEHELLQHRNHLEDLVKERTDNLSRTNNELKKEISERQRIEKELKVALQALEKSNMELDDFAYIASHDLKEPLRGINNFSSFLMEDYGNKLDKEGMRMLETLELLTKRLGNLIDDLLTYSRAGRTELSLHDTNLNLIIQEVLETLNIGIEEKGIEVKIPETLPVVFCDTVRIKEVFRNLISNAIKYNNKENPWIEIGFFENTFFVRDNGIGIREKHFEDVFKIFKRLHSRDKFGGGTGAGMTIIKKIIENHKGKIWLESEFGKGSTFYFTLGGA